MLITIDTSEPMNGTDRAILAAIIGRIPHLDTPSERPTEPTQPSTAATPPEPAAAPPAPAQAHTGPIPRAPGRPAFNPANPIPAYSARAQIANQPGVTLTPTHAEPAPEEPGEPTTEPGTADGDGHDSEVSTSSDTATTHTDETQPPG